MILVIYTYDFINVYFSDAIYSNGCVLFDTYVFGLGK